MKLILLNGLKAGKLDEAICKDVVQRIDGVCYHLQGHNTLFLDDNAMAWSYILDDRRGDFIWALNEEDI